MKAATYYTYGGPEVLRIEEIPKPSPADDEVLIRIKAVNINYGDLLARNFGSVSGSTFNMPLPFLLPAKLMFGIQEPRNPILGNEYSGVVEQAGKDVKDFGPGNEVLGYQAEKMGCYCEYICVKASGHLAKKPKNLSFEEAACISYGPVIAGDILERVEIKEGMKALINGASGSIGSAALQLLKSCGVSVTGVCGGDRHDYIRTLGADKVIDYKVRPAWEDNEKYDLVLDIYGRMGFGRCKMILKEKGVYLLASFKMYHIMQMFWTKISGKKKILPAMGACSRAKLEKVCELATEGVLRSIVDKAFRLEDISEAHSYAESGHKKGNVVVCME